MKLLIADDDLTSRAMLQAITSKCGFDPVLVEDGLQAWDIMSTEDSPRLVLLDWEMPELDGLAVCRHIRQNEDNDPPYIILLTGRSDTRDIVSGLDAGANDYISKPFDQAELQARLRVGNRMLDLQSALQEADTQLRFQATHDALTGLLNRGAVMEKLENDLSRPQQERSSLCIGLCDIDHFKNINDTHGHLAGDEVLREISRRFNQMLKPCDYIGRYGGEEFLFVIKVADDNCTEPFEQIREIVAAEPFHFESWSIPVTISIGITQFTPTAKSFDVINLLNQADKALYEAKNNGRNRIIMAST